MICIIDFGYVEFSVGLERSEYQRRNVCFLSVTELRAMPACNQQIQISFYRPLVFSGSICTSSPLTPLTVWYAGCPAYSCPPEELPDFPSISLDSEMGWLPRKRLRISIIPRLCRRPSAMISGDVLFFHNSWPRLEARFPTHLHSLNPLRSC